MPIVFTAPPAKKLVEIKDVTTAMANEIRLIWKMPTSSLLMAHLEANADKFKRTLEWDRQCYHRPKPRELKRAAIDELIGTSGVEYLGRYRQVGGCMAGDMVHFCNGGDVYATTIVFIGRVLRVDYVGRLIENNNIAEPEQM